MHPLIDTANDPTAAPNSLQDLLGADAGQKLLQIWEQRLKRWMDILLVFTVGLLALPIIFLIALAVRFDSPGGIIFKQLRLGKGGRKFKLLKFRTMLVNSDQILQRHLAANLAARREWEATHKIKDDPRITRTGKFLRRTSLDELPQLWNILAGEMSMVGPRPIVEEEVGFYHERINLYKQVRPGLTGLWQVSGRNNIDYPSRVLLDEYYIRNWSIWLDIQILARTVLAVLGREGAY